MDVLILNADGNPLSIMPLSIINWQTAIRLMVVDKVNMIAEYDNWTVRSPSTTMSVPSIVICTDYIKWNRQIKYSRSNVYLRDDYTCQLQSTYRCKQAHGKGHRVSELTLDHVVPRAHGGKTNWGNVTTACKDCNGSKGSDRNVRPKHAPRKPSYYELVAKRQKMGLTIRDLQWMTYLTWDEDLVHYHPYKGRSIKLTEYKNNQTEFDKDDNKEINKKD